VLNRIALFALILTLPIVLEGVPASLTPYAEKAHLALSESLTRLYELNRNRNAGWITPDEYAAQSLLRGDKVRLDNSPNQNTPPGDFVEPTSLTALTLHLMLGFALQF